MTGQYSYLVADLRSNLILGELPLTGVSYTKKLCDAGSFKATLDLSKEFTGDVYDLTSPALRVVYVLRGDTPQFGGIIWTRSYDSSKHTVDIAGADWWSYFNHRKVLPVLSGAQNTDSTYVAGLTVDYAGVEQNQLARDLVALAQSHSAGDIMVDVASDTSTSNTPRDRTYYGYKLTGTGDALKELMNDLGGPDMMFDVGPTDANGRPRRILKLGTPNLGQQGSPHVFEQGGNVYSFTWPSDGTRMITRMFSTTDGTAEGTPIAAAEDTTLYTYSWPLLEESDSYSGVTDMTTLFSHAQADQQVSRLPVVLPTLTINTNVEPTLDEIGLGDDARFVVPVGHEFFSRGLDTRLRIVAEDVQIRDEGGETAKLTMGPLLSNVY